MRATPLFPFAILFCAATASCTPSSRAEQAPAPPATHTSQPVSAKAAAVSSTPRRALLLGRIVDLTDMRIVQSVTPTAPDYELTLPGANLGIAYWTWGDLQAIDLSSGEKRWVTRPTVCSGSTILTTNDELFAICGSIVVAIKLEDGRPSSLGEGPMPFIDYVIGERQLFARDVMGRVRVWTRAEPHKRLVDSRLPEVAGEIDDGGLVAASSVDGVCAWGLRGVRDVTRTRRLDVACYDEQLRRRWSRTIKLEHEPVDANYVVPQTGPYYLVLRDEKEPGAAPRSIGHGAIVRWQDGEIVQSDSSTFATLEQSDGERIVGSPALEVFSRGGERGGSASFEYEAAETKHDRDHVYTLVKRRAPMLAAADLKHQRVVFATSVPEYNSMQLQLVHGLPIIRVHDRDTTYVSVYDPDTGALLYHDGREQDLRHHAF